MSVNGTPIAKTGAAGPVIQSLLDTDLYKFTMWQAMLHRHPGNHAVYRFDCRNVPAYPLAELVDDVRAELDALCALRFQPDELAYLAGLRFMKPDFIDFLSIFHFQSRFLRVWTEGERLCVEAEGPQVHVMGFEIFVLAIINELYFRRFDAQAALAEGRKRLHAKIDQLQKAARDPAVQARRHPFEFFDFGLRRRYSRQWHHEVTQTLRTAVPDLFKGTSNVDLARRLDLVPIGTMAHEYLQSYQAQNVRLRDFQREALEGWVQEYRGDLGVALTDVVGMDAFLADFDLYFAKLFDGLRHDSGDPIVWGEKALAHYTALRIDAHNKRLTFSDGLDVSRALALHAHFADRTQLGFGIGTHLTNDVGITPLSIVMKLVQCNGQPVAKVSDSPGKAMAVDETFLTYLKQVFGITT